MVQKIVNCSFQSAVVPKALKKAAVKPLIKKPSLAPDVLGNYRPVSNLQYLSTVLEKVCSQPLRTHLDDNNLQIKFQSAYRCGLSTETALPHVLNDLLSMTDAGNNAILVFLGLSAAFDTIGHTLLL